MIENYEVTDVYEVGDAATTIRDKDVMDYDELGQPGGVGRENLAEE